MADPNSLDDLEAELRRMEEELAALQGKPKKEKAKEARKAADEAPAPKKEKRSLFGRKKESPPPADAATPPAAPATAVAPQRASTETHGLPDAAPAAVVQPTFLPQSGRWTRAGNAWVLRADAEPLVVRRILDAEGRVVAEEAAPRDLLAAAPEPASAPAAGDDAPERPLHALAGKLSERKEKKRGLFGLGKRQRDEE